MSKDQIQSIAELKKIELHYSKEWLDYWMKYSSFDSWQFWVVLALLIIPLLLLLFFMDWKKSLQLGFYGYNVHVFFTYIDVFGAEEALWFYPYKILPILPVNISLDVSLVPVSYMFVYQLVMHRKLNYYVCMTGLSVILAFVLKPIMDAFGLFQFDRGSTPFHLLIGYLVVGILAKVVTDIFLYLQGKAKNAELKKSNGSGH